MCDDVHHHNHIYIWLVSVGWLVGWSVSHKLKFLIFWANQVRSEIYGYLQNPWDIPVNPKPPKPNQIQPNQAETQNIAKTLKTVIISQIFTIFSKNTKFLKCQFSGPLCQYGHIIPAFNSELN